MARKRHYRRNYNNKKVDPITGAIVGFFFIGYIIYNNLIKPNIENIVFFGKIFIPILIISTILIVYYLYKRKKRITQEEIENTPIKLMELKLKIKEFKALRNYKIESYYQDGLASFLQNNYPQIVIEKSINYNRPDIIIDNIAIEIKGPTGMGELKTIPQKIINYLKERDYLFIVLFNIKITDNPIKSEELYEIWKKDIYETFESKKDKVFFIEM